MTIDTATLEKLVELAKAASKLTLVEIGECYYVQTDQGEKMMLYWPVHDQGAEPEAAAVEFTARRGEFIALAANLAVPLATELMEARERIRELRLDKSALIATVDGMLRQHDTGERCFGFDHFEMARVIVAQAKDGTLNDPDVLKVEREEQEARTLLGDRTC